MKKSEILRIIREEVEVILTNEEATEMFDIDPAALIDELMEKTEVEESVYRLAKRSSRIDPKTGKPDPMQSFTTPGQMYRGTPIPGIGDTPEAAAYNKANPLPPTSQYTSDMEKTKKAHKRWDATQGFKSGPQQAVEPADPYAMVSARKKGRLKEEDLEEDKDWIQKAVDPEHEGDCTPMTKSTCTPARKALAKRFKKAGRKKKKEGGTGWQGKV